jgi:ParB family chromosome partitioning protein
VVARRSGLGKGLGALIPTEVSGGQGSALREVPIASIRPNPFQPRRHFDEETMASLAASIRELGVLQPVLVRQVEDGMFELIAGERRWRAAKRAGRQTMPVIVQEASDLHSLEQALVENLHREDLNPLEEAAAFQQLVDEFGYTHDQVANRVGKSRATVTNTLRLLQLPPGAQRALADGAISAGHARALLGTPDRSRQEELAQRVIAEGLTVRALEELVRASVAGVDGGTDGGDDAVEDTSPARSGAPRSDDGTGHAARTRQLPPPGIVELEELLADFLDTRVKVEMGAGRGRVLIEFATLEDLERIYKVMVEGR